MEGGRPVRRLLIWTRTVCVVIVRSAQIADDLEVEPSRFIDRLDMGCERKKK